MVKQFSNPGYFQISPVLMAILSIPSFYIGLGLLASVKVTIPTLAWYTGLLVIAIGGVIELFLRRILWIRVYQLLVMSIMATIHGTLLWTLTVTEHDLIEILSILIIVISIGAAAAMVTIAYQARLASRGLVMPHGTFGSLNQMTGIVNPNFTPEPIQQEIDRVQNRQASMTRLSPLIAGMTMFLVQIASASMLTVIMAAVAFLMMSIGLAGSVSAIIYAIYILQWERANKKKIFVKR